MIRTITAIAITALTATTSYAQEAQQDPCQVIGDVAQAIMERRQDGTPMSDLMQATGHIELARLLIIEAYKAPRMSVPANQQREIQDFRNTMESACYQAQ